MLSEEEKKLIQKIREQWEFWFKKQNISQLLHLYISSDCSNSQNYSERSRYPLSRATQDFLNDKDQQILLVLGDSGSGKTSLTLNLEQTYWETHSTIETMNGFIPIRIELRSYTTKTINGCIEDTLEKRYELSKEEINQLKKNKNIKLLLIFDGYDEIGGRAEFNIYRETKLSEWKCEIKVAATCRSQHFTGEEEFKRRFVLYQEQAIEILNESLKIIYVAPFSEAQMKQYLVQYSEEHSNNKEADKFPLEGIQELLKTQVEFKNLLGNPLILKIFSKVAPKLLNITDTSKSEVRKINRAKIYQAFLEDWFFRAKAKLETSVSESEIKEKDIEKYFFQYARQLAFLYYKIGITELRYEEAEPEWSEFEEVKLIQEGNNAFKEFFGSEKPEVVEARKACPLRRSGESTYSFVHKSFQDYLVGRHMYLVLKSGNEKLTLENWNVRYLSEDRAVLRFVAEIIEGDVNRKELEERLLKIIKSSSEREDIDIVSSNAISALNWNGYCFSGMDFRGIRIPKAYLKKVNFSGSNLSKSKLNGGYVRNSEWSETDLSGSDLMGLEFGEYPDWEQGSEVKYLVFNKQGTMVAAGDDKDIIVIWSYPRGQIIRRYRRVGLQSIKSIVFSPDGKYLAAGCNDGKIRIWEIQSEMEESIIECDMDSVNSVSWSGDGKRLAGGDNDGKIFIWEVHEAKGYVLQAHADSVNSVSWSGDGKQLASGSDDGTIRIWDASNGLKERELWGHTDSVNSVSWSGDGKQLASGSDDGTIRIWNALNGFKERELRGHAGRVTSVSWSLDGKRLLSGSWDTTIRLWEVSGGLEEGKFEGHTGVVTSVGWSVDGNQLVSGSEDRTIRIWDVESAIEERKLGGHVDRVTSVNWSVDGLWVVSGSDDGTIRIWEALSGIEKRKLEGHAGEVTSVSWSADGKWLASGSADETIRIWEALSGIEKRKLEGHKYSVISLSECDDKLASGSGDGTIRIWDVKSGVEKRDLEGHTSEVTCVSWSSDGKWLASGSADQTIRIWNVQDEIEERKLESHTGEVTSVSWSRDGTWLVSGYDNGAIWLWDVKVGKYTEVAVFNQIVWSVSFCKSSERREEYLAAGIGNGVYLFFVEQSNLDEKPRLILKWRTEFYLRAQNANLENAKIDDMNRRLLEQRGAKKSNPNVQSQPNENPDIPSSSVQSESTKKPEGVIDMFTYWEKQPLTLELLSRWNKKELNTFKFNLISYSEQQVEAVKDNKVEQAEWLMLIAVITDELSTLKELAKKDENVLHIMNIRDALKGNTLLHWACLFNRRTTAKWLLEKGIISLDEENDLGLRAIHMAILGDVVEVISLPDWENPIMPAVEIEVSADKKIKCLPLPFAVLIGRERMMNHLLGMSQYEETIESQATFGSILHLAVWGEHAELLQRLLYNEKVKKHNLYNKPDDKNRTALGLAVFLSRYMMMRILLQHPSIEVNAHPTLRVPAHIGVERGDTKAVRKLIHCGANTEIEEENSNLKEHAKSLRDAIPKAEANKNPQWVRLNGLVSLIEREKAREERERYRGELGVKLTKIENLTFRGGGGKAIAYGGALEEITDKVPDFWKNLRRVGGTSAGALTSLLISVGYLPQKVSELLKDFDFEAIIKPGLGSATSELDKSLRKKLMSALKLCATGIQGAYATKQTQSFLDVFLPLWKARKFTGLSDGEVLREKLRELVKNALITQGFSTTIKDGKAYLTHSGKIIGENKPLLNQDLGLLTLGHWKMIVEGSLNSQHIYKHLYIVTSCVSGREMGVEVFNSESGSYDDVVMIDPVACSMSYPFAIEPQKVRRVTSDGQGQLSQESYLDGGMLMNDPKKLFDAHGYVDPHDKLGDKRFPRYNKKTLSLTLVSGAPPEFDMPEEKEVKTIFGLIKVFASFYLHAETYLREQGYTERYREVAIPDCGVTVRDLNMSEENKKKLQDSGRSTMQKFMKQLGDPDKSKMLSGDSKETFDPTQPAGPSIKKQ